MKQGLHNPNYRHGFASGKRHPLYIAWQNMKSRCNNPNNTKFSRYGGRGVSICSEWLTFESFAKWALSAGWQTGLTLDRKDNDGDYTPTNCQWIICGLNSRKKSTTKLSIQIAIHIRKRLRDGEAASKLAQEFGVSKANISFIEHNITWNESLS